LRSNISITAGWKWRLFFLELRFIIFLWMFLLS
jgi:uncharacterized membrane protein